MHAWWCNCLVGLALLHLLSCAVCIARYRVWSLEFLMSSSNLHLGNLMVSTAYLRDSVWNCWWILCKFGVLNKDSSDQSWSDIRGTACVGIERCALSCVGGAARRLVFALSVLQIDTRRVIVQSRIAHEILQLSVWLGPCNWDAVALHTLTCDFCTFCNCYCTIVVVRVRKWSVGLTTNALASYLISKNPWKHETCLARLR